MHLPKSRPWKPPNHGPGYSSNACCAGTKWLWNDMVLVSDGSFKVRFTACQWTDYPKSRLRSKSLTYALPLQTQSWYADHQPIWFPHSIRISVVGWSCPVKGFWTRTAFCPHFWSAAQSESDAHSIPFPSTWGTSEHTCDCFKGSLWSLSHWTPKKKSGSFKIFPPPVAVKFPNPV